MKLKIERQYLAHLNQVYMPTLVAHGRALAEIHDIGSRDYLVNLVTVETLAELGRLFAKKLANTAGYYPTLNLTSAQALALYGAMYAYPIAPQLYWDNMKRDFLIAALDQWRANPEAQIIYEAK